MSVKQSHVEREHVLAGVCAMRRNLVNHHVTAQLDGGRLHVYYDEKDGIELAGGAEFCYEGRIDL